MPAPHIDLLEKELQKAAEHIKSEIAALRTDRASPVMVENLIVEAYGSRIPLKQLAAIAVPEPRTLVLTPWDRQMTAAIAKALETADLGVMPSVQGETIRVTLPPLTQERRTVLQKEVAKRCEDARIAIRRIRDNAMDQAKKAEKEKEISEDALFHLKDQIEKLVTRSNNEIEALRDAKTKELLG